MTREAHTIKGLAGQLGMGLLQEKSALLEAECKHKGNNIGLVYTQFKEELDNIEDRAVLSVSSNKKIFNIS